MPEYRVNADVLDEKGSVVAKVAVVLTLTAVQPNAPPQYTGATTINDLVVGVGRQLQGMDPDNDPITWSVDEANAGQVTVSPAGVITPLVPLGGIAVTVYMDDGKA